MCQQLCNVIGQVDTRQCINFVENHCNIFNSKVEWLRTDIGSEHDQQVLDFFEGNKRTTVIVST
jgi:hypothetical protein